MECFTYKITFKVKISNDSISMHLVQRVIRPVVENELDLTNGLFNTEILFLPGWFQKNVTKNILTTELLV